MKALTSCKAEEWRDVPGYEGLYKVSDTGLLSSPNGRLMKGTKNYNGYLRVNLRKEGNVRQYCLHRLVAQAFVPNPEDKPEVNHKNGKRDDCRAENLEWCTHSENQLHRRRVLGSGGGKPKRAVVCLTTGETYESLSEAAVHTGCALSAIYACCRGSLKKTHGLQFAYKERRT